MKENWTVKKEWISVSAVTLILWMLELLVFTETGRRYVVLAFALGAAALLFLRSEKPLWNVSSLLFLGYIVFAGLGAFWAMSGKFFLREYSKIVIMLPIFLYVLLKPSIDRGFVRRVMKALAIVSAWVAFLSVETISTGLFRLIIDHTKGLRSLLIGFADHRLYGIYGNSNVEASIYAIGILAALACLAEATSKKDRIISVVLCSVSAFAFLFCISIGAMMCFALAVVIYLIAAGKERVRVLFRMLCVAIPTVIFVTISFVFATRGGRLSMLILLMLIADAVVCTLLEIFLVEKISSRFQRHTKLPLIIMLAMVGVAAVYLFAAMNLTGPYTFTAANNADNPLARADYTAPGEHTLTVEADGEVSVRIYYQTRYDVLQDIKSEVYKGSASSPITFSVPEDSIICNYWFLADPGTKMTSAMIDGETSIPLRYKILPSFIADRIQGAWSSSSLLYRMELWKYGVRLFRISPVAGLGCGAYESGLARVEDIVYETKYAHNHYIQVLLESGIIGFALYVAGLLSLAGVLVKKRRMADDPEYGWVYPVLAAVLVMVCTVTAWDLPMSRAIYLAMVYAVFAIIIRLMAIPLPVKQIDESTLTKREKILLEGRKEKRDRLVQLCCAVVPVLFAVSLVANIYARELISKPVSSEAEYYANQQLAAKIDLYEYNDAKLSYVLMVGSQGNEMYLDQANQYADELMQVSSNAIPNRLQEFYINMGQYEKAMEAAQRSTIYSAADPDVWNATFSRLWEGIILNEEALAQNLDSLLPLLLKYYDTFNERNETAIQPIELEEPASSAYRMLGELKRLDQIDRQQVVDYLNERLAEVNGLSNE